MTAPFSSDRNLRPSFRSTCGNPRPKRLSAHYPNGNRRTRGPAVQLPRRRDADRNLGRKLSSVAIELGAVGLEPVAREIDRAGRELAAQLPELRTVIHFLQMRDLVPDHVIEHILRREHQSPGERELAFVGAGAPAALGVADADLGDFLAEDRGLVAGARLDLALRLGLQPFMHAPRQMLFITGDVDLALFAPDDAAGSRSMADAMRLA